MKPVQRGARLAATLELAPPGAGKPLHARIAGRLALALGEQQRSCDSRPWLSRLDAVRFHRIHRMHRTHRIRAKRILAGLRLFD